MVIPSRIRATLLLSVALVATSFIGCGGNKRTEAEKQQAAVDAAAKEEQQPAQTAAPVVTAQKWSFLPNKGAFPPCDVDKRDALFYDMAAKALYICRFKDGGYSYGKAPFDSLRGDKGAAGDKGATGDKGPNGPAGDRGS